MSVPACYKDLFLARNYSKFWFICDHIEDTTKCKPFLFAFPGSQGRFCGMKSFPLWKSMAGEGVMGRGRLGRLPLSTFIISYVTRTIQICICLVYHPVCLCRNCCYFIVINYIQTHLKYLASWILAFAYFPLPRLIPYLLVGYQVKIKVSPSSMSHCFF